MSPALRIATVIWIAALGSALSGCARESAEPAETFHWCAQPIAFSPPPPTWYREATNGSGLLGVRFVLKRGLGEVITLATYDNLDDSLGAASADAVTLADVLPRIRFSPERMREPDRWRVGSERDTTLSGRPAYVSDGTLLTLDRAFRYREIYWVVGRCAFQAVYQGTPRNLPAFDRLVGSIAFPEAAHDSTD